MGGEDNCSKKGRRVKRIEKEDFPTEVQYREGGRKKRASMKNMHSTAD